MANRTDPLARAVHGTNPQFLISKIIRAKIHANSFWKEECFGLTAETLIEKAVELQCIGGTFGGNRKPAAFLCLILKLLQIQPTKDIVVEYVKQEDYKYLRALGSFYLRLTANSTDVFQYLEPMLNDYRKLRHLLPDGKCIIVRMDEFIDDCLRKDHMLDIDLPAIPGRAVVDESHQIGPRISLLEDDLEFAEEELMEDEEFERRAKEHQRAEAIKLEEESKKRELEIRRKEEEEEKRREEKRREERREKREKEHRDERRGMRDRDRAEQRRGEREKGERDERRRRRDRRDEHDREDRRQDRRDEHDRDRDREDRREDRDMRSDRHERREREERANAR